MRYFRGQLGYILNQELNVVHEKQHLLDFEKHFLISPYKNLIIKSSYYKHDIQQLFNRIL